MPNRNQGWRGSRGFAPVTLAVLFLFSSLSGFAWGLIVRTPHPTVKSIAVLPGAREVATPTIKPVGLSSPTVMVINSTDEGLLSYVFYTSISPGEVAAWYREMLINRYGFHEPVISEPTPGLQVLRFERETTFRVVYHPDDKQKLYGRGGRDLEKVSVTIQRQGSGQLRVEVLRNVIEFTWR